MPQAIEFNSVTSRFSLPLLFPGQVQKEFHVNEAHMLIDALLHASVEGVADEPPTNPQSGDSWLVSSAPIGDWVGSEDHLAVYNGSAWALVAPREGMKVYEKQTAQILLYRNQWTGAVEPDAPQGGSNIDVEARTAINELVIALKSFGLLSGN